MQLLVTIFFCTDYLYFLWHACAPQSCACILCMLVRHAIQSLSSWFVSLIHHEVLESRPLWLPRAGRVQGPPAGPCSMLAQVVGYLRLSLSVAGSSRS